ncbi:bifunctional UDP-N-acetylglucosamine diphosphorylase/glucosamine-1-phosphate N-acetyltransferase GlmU [Micrococcoides hystricis]|uniref:Bifunctional protein GlmU n=1 Tax=Micrococcoides hystricis TaxID=1572761 RepID=A0ABV6PAA8_9MICC
MVAPTAVIVLAAGAGTRMKSNTPKVMHQMVGRSMVGHALFAAKALNPEHLVAVVRHQRDKVAAHITACEPSAIIVDQDEIPGTGSAVKAGLHALPNELTGTIVVSYGDVPLLTSELIAELVAEHEAHGNAVTVLTTKLEDPTGYGRIIRSADGAVERIVEQKDATEEERAVQEINSGIYAFDAAMLRTTLPKVTTDNAQGEMYLTDVLGLSRQAGGRVAALVTDDRWQVEGANDRVQLATLGQELQRRVLEGHMRNGTTVVDPDSTYVDVTVTLEQDTTLLPGTHLHGTTHIAEDAVIGPDTTLIDCRVEAGATVTRAHATEVVVGPNAKVGPFTYMRPGTQLGEDTKVGAFYETKNITLGKGSKLSHLGYAGDAEIGEYTNIGCGNITANYDGQNKHRTIIGDYVRTSSNTVFVAPVEVGDGAYTGAGAVVRKNVPAGALAISVAPQRNSEDWTLTKRPGTPSAEAAQAAKEA